MSQNTEEIIAKYVSLRDRKAELKKEYDTAAGKLDAAMETIETYLMALMGSLGVESVRTDAGTAYKTTRVKASISDREAARKFILDNEAIDLLEMRASSTAIKQYMQDNGGVPPGFAVLEENTVNIRRS